MSRRQTFHCPSLVESECVCDPPGISMHDNIEYCQILPTSEGHLNFSVQNFGGGGLYYTGIIN